LNYKTEKGTEVNEIRVLLRITMGGEGGQQSKAAFIIN